MIHIADTKVARRYGDFFIRQIHKFEEVRDQRETGLLAGDRDWEVYIFKKA
jgi:hypothetical protein